MSSSFQGFSKTYLPQIESALDAALQFDFKDDRTALSEAMRYSTLNGGKRLRALLTLMAFEVVSQGKANQGKANQTTIMPVASAIEIIHAFSLVHDDLPAMDDDDLRRGKPSCHIAFGEDVAILAGDALLQLAPEYLLTELPQHYAAELVLKAVAYVMARVGEVVQGQTLDIKAHERVQDEAALRHLHHLKTGSLFQAAIVAPALLAAPDQVDLIEALEQYGFHLGLLFQITDDIIDATSTVEQLGKTPNKDREQGKATYVSLFGLSGAKAKAAIEVRSAQDILEGIAQVGYQVELFESVLNYIVKRRA
jgi:geranylgeranyl pyrophosphate synthase